MRLGTAIELLIDNYRYASDKEWIQDKVAWALYHTWKEADRKTEPTISKMEQVETETQTFDKPTKCLGCLYSDLDKDFHPCASCENFSKYVGEVSGKDEPQTERT